MTTRFRGFQSGMLDWAKDLSTKYSLKTPYRETHGIVTLQWVGKPVDIT